MTSTDTLEKAPRGRPRAENVNPTAVRDLARQRALTLKEVHEAAQISEGHFYDALLRQKGLSRPAVVRLAQVLGCEPGTIAPTVTGEFTSRRRGDAV